MKAALDYGRVGWSVIPIKCRGKRPLIRWQVYQYRHAVAAEVAEWFRRWPDANIAVVTGVVSGLAVLDLDPRHGADGYCQLNDIQTAQPIGGFIPLLSGHDLGAGHLLPFTECPRAKLTIVNRPRQVPTQSEQISYHAIHCKEALSLSS